MRRIAVYSLVCMCLTTGAAAAATRHRSHLRGHVPAATVVISPHAGPPKTGRKHAPPRRTVRGAARATALLGDRTVEPRTHSNPPGVVQTFASRATRTGKVKTIFVYVAAGTRASRVIAGLYTNRGGSPASLVTSGFARAPRAGRWTRIAVRSAAVTAGRTYWIAMMGSGGRLRFRDRRSGSCHSETSSARSRTLAASWHIGQMRAVCPASTYVTGTTAPPPTTTTTTPPPTTTTTTAPPPTTGTTTSPTAPPTTPPTPAAPCTEHVTTSTFTSALAGAGKGSVLCLAPGSYGSFNGAAKSATVTLEPDTSAGAKAPTGNATGDVDGNVVFSGGSMSSASNLTIDGITFTDDVTVSGTSHDVLLEDSLLHAHLVIDDTSMKAAAITANYDMFPGDRADCVDGPEGRISIGGSSDAASPDGVTIENSNIGGATSQCDGIQTGGDGPRILGNWIHDYHYAGDAHTDGVQDYGGRDELVEGNFFYDVPDCYVSYDGTVHAVVQDNICVNDGSQDNGASPNVLVVNDDNGSIVSHNTLAGFEDSYGSAGGVLSIGSKSAAGSGTELTDNIATSFNNCENGNCRPYTESHNLFVLGPTSGVGDLRGTPIYRGGACGVLTSSQGPFCPDKWADYLLTAASPGHDAAGDGTDVGAYGTGPVTPGGP